MQCIERMQQRNKRYDCHMTKRTHVPRRPCFMGMVLIQLWKHIYQVLNDTYNDAVYEEVHAGGDEE